MGCCALRARIFGRRKAGSFRQQLKRGPKELEGSLDVRLPGRFAWRARGGFARRLLMGSLANQAHGAISASEKQLNTAEFGARKRRRPPPARPPT